MASSVTSTIYWGSGIEGQAFLEKLLKHCKKHGISLSEMVQKAAKHEMERGTPK